MLLAKLVVYDVFIKAKMLRPIPKGVIGATVEIEYACAQWQNMKKTVVFHGCATKDVVDAGTTVEVPAEVVAQEGRRLRIGVYGTDTENDIAIPTLWCDLGLISDATDPSGDVTTDPALPVWAQLIKQLEELEAMGGIPGPVGPTGDKGDPGLSLYYSDQSFSSKPSPGFTQYMLMRKNIDSVGRELHNGDFIINDQGFLFKITNATGSIDHVDGEYLFQLKGSKGDTGATGPTGQQGPDGEDGFSPVAKVERTEYGVRITITDAEGTTSAEVKDGKDGEGGSGGNADLDGYATEQWVKDGYQPKGDYLGASALPEAVNTALALAKASGEFDGEKGEKGDKGDTGDQGEDGKDGVSPVVSISSITGGHRITITDKNGSKVVDVMDGTDGKNGSDGTSVTVKSVNESTADGGSNVVTFSDGKTLTVKNGDKGDKGDKGDTGATGPAGADGAKGDTGATGSAGKDGTDGADGQRGHGILKVTTAPTSYTTTTGGKAPIKRMALSTIKTQANVDEVLVGDQISYGYYLYNIYYLDATYAYMDVYTSIRGATGATGSKGADGTTPVKGTDYWTDADKAEIIEEVSQNITIETVPDYVRTEAETVARIVNQHQSNDSIVFPFLSDAHCGYYTDKTNEATKLAGQLLNLIAKRVPFDFIANGGDMANGAWDTTREMTYENIEDYTELTADAHKGVPAVWCPGNHDDAPYMATADRATQKDMFALIGRKSRVSGAVCPNGCNYGYLDLENRKLRVIYLDTDDKRSWGTVQVGSSGSAPEYLNAHNVGGVQLRWLAETALDFTGKENPAEWSIVVISHVALNISGTITDAVSGAVYDHNTANVATVLNDYRAGKSRSIDHNGITVNYDFSALENRAVVICVVHGHNHKFTSEDLSGIPSIGCPNVMNGRERESDDGNTYTKTAGTADGTSFCILTIDRENCMIYADCVGAGYDRDFEYTTEVISYTNQLPISTDASGNVYNGKGYKEDTYISSGNDSTRAGTYTSGFIACKPNDTLYFKNVGMQNGQDGHRLASYDSSKAYLGLTKTNNTEFTAFKYGADGNITSVTIPNVNSWAGTAFIRFCCSYIGDDSIVTVNEPIE